MARRRLTPPRPDFLGSEPSSESADHTSRLMPLMKNDPPTARAPIAQVAGEAAAEAALSELSAEIARTRTEERLVERLPIDTIDSDYLVRDRQSVDPGEMEALVSSIRIRGQQMPVEVVDRGTNMQPRYGLISGWRRLKAISLVGDVSEVLAIVRHPETAAEAYVSMVEENEIRAGISFYERARIVVKSIEAGVFPDAKTALNGLFGNVSRAKRSKIKSFMTLVTTLDDALRFPSAISEKAGLVVAQAIGAGQGDALHAGLLSEAPQTAEQESSVLSRLVRSPRGGATVLRDHSGPVPDINFEADTGRIIISGPGVDLALERRVRKWLHASRR